jgi:hypothetical protein
MKQTRRPAATRTPLQRRTPQQRTEFLNRDKNRVLASEGRQLRLGQCARAVVPEAITMIFPKISSVPEMLYEIPISYTQSWITAFSLAVIAYDVFLRRM